MRHVEDGLEALHHCMSVGWDKKTRSLPRLVVMLVRGLPGLKVESNQ